MDELTNRSRCFAEAVVTMVSLVLPTAALQGKSEMTGIDVPKFVLILAAPTIITGICPLLACCILNNQHVMGDLPQNKKEHMISDLAALLSAAILLSLACWIATFTASVELWCTAGALFLFVMGIRIISYCTEKNKQGLPPRTKDFHTILDGSHEFLCCMTGIHFLWLESLALEGLIGKRHGIGSGLSEIMGSINIVCCAIGLIALLIEMTPPLQANEMKDIAENLFWFDTVMIFSIATVLGAAILKSLVLPGLLPHILGTLIIIVGLVLIAFKYVSCPEQAGLNENREPPKLAPLGLTKLMVTGFLAVYVSVDSTDGSITYWFLTFAAAAILSGLIWRLLTQHHVRKVLENNKLASPVSKEIMRETAVVASSAKTACFCAHTFLAIAALLLMIEIYNVNQSTSAPAPAPAPACT